MIQIIDYKRIQEQLSTNMQQLQELDNQMAQSQEEINTINVQN